MIMPGHGTWCLPMALFEAPGGGPVSQTQIDTLLAEQQGPPRKLLCRDCRYVISDEGARISVAGCHTHTCVNPHGLVYRIGCFSRAPGCFAVGDACSAYSWFTDHAWQVTVCNGCGVHIGWRFSGQSAFYGLIVRQLRYADE